MVSAEQIDALLPQTQCGLCGYKGCMPYATALAENNAAINLCPPGGVPGLLAIAKLVKQDPAPFIADMEKTAKPALRAVIREAECIGCTKCIQACPVDAILGAAKQMHTIITDECTGCELCVEPCPVDCIDMIVVQENNAQPDHFRARYLARESRLQNQSTPTENKKSSVANKTMIAKKDYIQAAILRARLKNK